MDRFENRHCERDISSTVTDGGDICVDLMPSTTAVKDALQLIEKLGPEAHRTLATAATAQFGEWLGWPHWLTRGTSLPNNRPLPDRITLADDLIIIANIVDQGEAGGVIARLFGEFKIPGAPITVPALYNAPTLRDALDFFIRAAAFGTPFLKINCRRCAAHPVSLIPTRPTSPFLPTG